MSEQKNSTLPTQEPMKTEIGTMISAEPLVPIEWVRGQMKLFDKDVDEEGMLLMAKAQELFMKQIVAGCTANGTREFNYDNFADHMQTYSNPVLRDFFPRRVRYRDVVHRLFPDWQGKSDDNGTTSNQEGPSEVSKDGEGPSSGQASQGCSSMAQYVENAASGMASSHELQSPLEQHVMDLNLGELSSQESILPSGEGSGQSASSQPRSQNAGRATSVWSPSYLNSSGPLLPFDFDDVKEEGSEAKSSN